MPEDSKSSHNIQAFVKKSNDINTSASKFVGEKDNQKIEPEFLSNEPYKQELTNSQLLVTSLLFTYLLNSFMER